MVQRWIYFNLPQFYAWGTQLAKKWTKKRTPKRPPAKNTDIIGMDRTAVRSCLCQFLIHLHQLSHTFGFRIQPTPEAVGLHDCFVILLVSLAELRRHGDFIIQIGETAIRVQCSGIQDSLCGLLDVCFLCIRRCRPRKVVIDDILGIAIITF